MSFLCAFCKDSFSKKLEIWNNLHAGQVFWNIMAKDEKIK